jgi:hypothetical protein
MTRKLTVAVLTVAIFTIPQTASADTVAWGIGSSGETPAYTVPIHFVDAMIDTLRPDRRREWRQARNRALTQWGIPFTVTRLSESSLPYVFDDNIGTVGIDGMLVPDAILIVRNRMSAHADQGGYSSGVNGGIAILTPWAPWWKSASNIIPAVAHEVGHALGFYHGGTGVMSGAERVSDEERALAQAYYGTA